jgi:hypothetical protein
MRLCYEHQKQNRTTRPVCCAVCTRLMVEADIAERTIKALFAAHFAIRVNNGDEPSDTFHFDALAGMQPSANFVLDAMFQTDDEFLEVSDAAQNPRGWVRFVYGNDGYDVISDYTVNLESALAPVNAYADTLA